MLNDVRGEARRAAEPRAFGSIANGIAAAAGVCPGVLLTLGPTVGHAGPTGPWRLISRARASAIAGVAGAMTRADVA